MPFKMFDAPLTRIVMIKMPDGFNGVYFLGNHMIVDAQSLICFLKDIIELYCMQNMKVFRIRKIWHPTSSSCRETSHTKREARLS